MGRIHLKTKISVIFKKSSRKNAKNFLKTYKNKTIDELLDSNFYGIPKKYTILEVLVGSETSFLEAILKKYKIEN